MKCIREENEKESQDRNHILESQQQAYNACVKKLDAFIDMRAGGEITEEEFLQKKQH